MAEALPIIGLVANIFQFIELGVKIISASRQALSSAKGTTVETEDLLLLTEDIKNSSERYNAFQLSLHSKDEIAMRKYAEDCDKISKELVMLLEKLTVRPTAKFPVLESLRVGVQGAIKQKELDRLEIRLKELDGRMRVRLSNALGDRRYSRTVALLTTLDDDNKRMDINSSTNFDALAQSISTVLSASQTQTIQVIDLLGELQKQADLAKKHQDILRSLMFNEFSQRYSDVEQAHSATLEWLHDRDGSILATWLETGSGMLWISGQAGSGKSTMMKYLCNHWKTKAALERWAGSPENLVLANFFFWYQGKMIQKSRGGLLQGLLFQILRANPTYSSKLCPEHISESPWTLEELLSVFQKLSSVALGTTKFCFFIDGLDEYHGEAVDIIQVVKMISGSPNIKICASSRDWTAFVLAFSSSCPSIALEDHNMDDIKAYIQVELANTLPFLESVREDPRCENIVSQIATRARGVWLWVFLVVRGLQRDLLSKESYDHLKKRIENIPPKLDNYFRRMWSQIDPIYREESAKILLVMLVVSEEQGESFPLLGQRCLESELLNSNYAIEETITDWTNHVALTKYAESFSDLEERARIRVNDRCRDLVRVRKNQGYAIPNSWGAKNLSIYRSHLGFLHRTVRDFLQQTFYDTLVEDAKDFSPVKSLSMAYLSLVKRHPISVLDQASVTDMPPKPASGSNAIIAMPGGIILTSEDGNERVLIAEFRQNTAYGRGFHQIFQDFWRLALSQKVVDVDVMDEFMRVTTCRSDRPWIGFIADHLPALYRNAFEFEATGKISFAICMGLSEQVRHAWKHDTLEQFHSIGLSPLILATKMDVVERHVHGDLYLAPELIEVLLDLGCDLNYVASRESQTVGSILLKTILASPIGRRGSIRTEEDLYETLQILFSRNLLLPGQGRLHVPGEESILQDDLERLLRNRLGVARSRDLMSLREKSAISAKRLSSH